VDVWRGSERRCLKAWIGPTHPRRKIRRSNFTADTTVMLCDGTSKSISEIEEGDLVLTRNEETGELSCWPAVSPYSSPNRALIDVELVDDRGNVELLETTFDHPFFVLGEGWVRVEHLEVGDIVPTTDGQATVVGLAWKGQLATVYNFGVEQTRSYFVGETGAWVHNCFPKSVEDAIAQGLIKRGGGTHKILSSVEAQFSKQSPNSVESAMGALGKGAEDVGMGTGFLKDYVPGQRAHFQHGGGLETIIEKGGITRVVRSNGEDITTVWEYTP
jgi:hypothetical protein